MRICVLTHNLKNDNGAGVFSRHLVQGLREVLGAEVVVLTTEGSGLAFEQPILYPNWLKLLVALPRVRQIVKTCDAVHALDAYPYGILAALAAYGLKKKMIITAVGTGSVQPLYHRSWPFARFTKWSYGQAAATTAISRFTRDLILARVPNLAITVINPGVDYETFSNARGEHQSADAKIAVQDTAGRSCVLGALQPYLLSVGSIRWRKGYKQSIRAFARVHREFPELRYVIVGRREREKYYQELLAIARDQGVASSVIFLDKVDSAETLRALYRSAGLFCLMSQNFGHDVEGFGIVFLEAAAAGLPVVGSRGSGAEDAVSEGTNGFLVDCKDEEGSAQAMLKILKDERLRGRMGKASLAWAKESSWDKRIAEYAALYKNLLK